MGGKYKVVFECVEVNGTCPVYKVGSKVVVDECLVWRTDDCPVRYREELSHANCYPFLVDIAPYFRSLCRGITPSALGIAGADGKGYLTCKNLPVNFYHEKGDYTHGNATFKVTLIPIEENYNDLWSMELERKKLPPYASRRK